jgi:hypothetical protein
VWERGMANAVGRPIAPLVLSLDEREYLERQESLVHTRSLADFITTTSGFRFSVHTGRLLCRCVAPPGMSIPRP